MICVFFTVSEAECYGLFLSTHLTKPSLAKHRQSDQPTGKLALPTAECMHANVCTLTIFPSKALPM